MQDMRISHNQFYDDYSHQHHSATDAHGCHSIRHAITTPIVHQPIQFTPPQSSPQQRTSSKAAVLTPYQHNNQQQHFIHKSTPILVTSSKVCNKQIVDPQQLETEASTQITSSDTAFSQLKMGGERSAFRSLISSTSAAAFAMDFARQYAAAASQSIGSFHSGERNSALKQTQHQLFNDYESRPLLVDVVCSDSDQEINVNDDSDNDNLAAEDGEPIQCNYSYTISATSKVPLQLTKQSR